MYQKCGTKARTRFLDITKLSNALGRSVCNALIGMHAFAGCDTISAFAGRGKMRALKQMKSDKAYQEAFTELGRSWEVSEELSEKLQDHLPYVPSFHPHNSVTRSSVQGVQNWTQLPPCEDCLSMHILRANYQAAIWRRCLEPSPFVPSPTNCGWTTDENGNLVVEWMRGSSVPDAVLQLLSCKCVRSCKLPVCNCLSNGLKCTDMCRLQTCSNQATEEEPQADLSDSDVDEDDDEE